jgi:8-oxo-dGTP pyrophosphatase MutT (NUDIX family)
MNDSLLDTVRDALALRVPPLQPLPPSDGSEAAAVAVVLRATMHDLELLLIKRAHNAGDPWSGHIALPGGRHDAADDSLLETAIREAHEETAVTLAANGSTGLLGRLETVAPRSARLPRLTVVPFVFGVPGDTCARADSHEVERIRWVSLGRLRDPDVAGTVDIALPRGVQSFPCLRLGDDVVWGLTYRILSNLLERVSPPGSPPTRR